MSSTPDPYRSDDADDDVSGDLTGSFLKQTDFSENEDAEFTISHVDKRHFEAKNGRPAMDKWVLTLEGEPERLFGLNKTNLRLMAKWFGKRAHAWVGQRIIVYRDESVSFAGQLVGGLRVRRLPTSKAASADEAARARVARETAKFMEALDDVPGAGEEEVAS